VWLKNAISAVIEQPNHAPVFDGPPEQRIRLQQHLQPFWRGFRLPGTDNGAIGKAPISPESGEPRYDRSASGERSRLC
jgi:hypothetical protein